jgi:protein SCO1/2
MVGISNVTRRAWLAQLTAPGGRPQFAEPLSGREIIQRRNLPNVPLVTHEGKRVLFYDDVIRDRVVAINLMYADCEGVCPTITMNLVKAHAILRTRTTTPVRFCSLTVKPETDSPDKLKAYAEMHHADGDWLFLTGEPDDVELLRRRLGFVDLNPKVDKDKASHSGVVRYGNEPLALWGACPGSTSPEWLATEIGFVIPGMPRA